MTRRSDKVAQRRALHVAASQGAPASRPDPSRVTLYLMGATGERVGTVAYQNRDIATGGLVQGNENNHYHPNMNALAMLWTPNLNPLGAPSIFAVIVCLILAGLTSPLVDLSRQTQRIITTAAPLAIAAISAITVTPQMVFLWIGRWTFSDADRHAAGVILCVFGFVFALHCFWFLSIGYRLVGWVFTLLYGSLIVFDAAGIVMMRTIPSWQHYRDWPIFLAVAVFLILWTPFLAELDQRMRRRLRIERGCCGRCGYNLTGNVSGICPECGLPIMPTMT